MKINGKDYKIPEINVKTMRELEEYGLYLASGEVPKKVFTIISAFIRATAHVNLDQACEIIEKQIESGAGIGEWLEDITDAIDKSKLLKQVKEKDKTKKSIFRV